MIQYNFAPQKVKGKIKIIGTGLLCMDENEAAFWYGDTLLGVLKNPKVTSITSHGIRIKGIEQQKKDKQGRDVVVYQEWYCSFIQEVQK